ncbi:porin [Terrihabitans rhizophilus]|uniref:Porin n=1 Tax=Terrihabitans rhizophilus TaxID=3092662 RepID=A0ABU4RQH6_9HYPH|nr:porin [Terrihabitans sp. PJ23]MDX6807096.1 porin [Terrihabitans sp. PJ23]
MINYKSLIIGAGLASVAVSGSFAADLPMAEPVEYVKVCDTYGKGYFYIPGTDTCLKIGGLVRMDSKWEEDGATDDEEGDDFYTDVRGRLQVDARSETEWGTLRSFIEFEGRSDSNGGYDDGASSVNVRQAFVQFAGFTAGRLSRSLYDFVPYKTIGDLFSDEQVNTFAYTASLGGGFEFNIGMEDKYFRARPFDLDDGESDLDQVWPNGIASLVVKQAWGDAKISAAVQDNEGDGFEGIEDSIGWAVQAGLSVNLPTEAKGSKVWVQAAYTEGATSYIGGEDFSGNFRNDPDFGGGLLRDQDENGENVEAFSVGGGVAYFWNKSINSHVSVIYSDFDRSDATAIPDFNVLFVEASTFWSPVSNLELGLALQYQNLEIEGVDLGEDEDQFAGVLRVARTF